MTRVFCAVGKYKEAEAMASDAFYKALGLNGPAAMMTLEALDEYAGVLLEQGKLREAKALMRMAIKLGVDCDSV